MDSFFLDDNIAQDRRHADKTTCNIEETQRTTALERYIIQLQWLKLLWNHENMFETMEFEIMSINHSAKSGGIKGLSFSIFFK